MLKKHPDIFLPTKKELHFFNVVGKDDLQLRTELFPFEDSIQRYITREFSDYCRYFEKVESEKIIGDMTPSYILDAETSIRNIYRYLPNPEFVKILILIRNPVDASYSHYNMQYRKNLEYLSYEDSIKQSEVRRKYGHYRRDHIHGFQYCSGIKQYLDNFRDVLVLTQEQLYSNPAEELGNIFSFLGVEEMQENITVEHRNKGDYCSSLDDDLRRILYFSYFKEDVDKLEFLLGLSLDSWKYSTQENPEISNK